MASIIETLGRELEELERQYTESFAGQDRSTRDIALLDSILARGRSIVSRIDQIPEAARGPDLVRFRDAAAQAVNLYAQERGAILRAQEIGPDYAEFGAEATAANLVFARYARHFAGKDRSTRDLGLLGELVDELKQIDKRMSQILETTPSSDFDNDRRIVRENVAQYQREIGQIEGAQKSGEPDQQASVLATLANAQFSLYQVHFAGEARVSRRPALLMRIISSLKKTREAMIGFRDGGLNLDFNTRNISIVEERLKVYENELTEVRKLRQATSMPDIMGELGGAANKLFDAYRSNFADKQRAQVDLDLLGNICDKLGEIRRQMSDMARAEDNEMNSKNLEIVTEQLVMFEGEYEAVVRLRAPSGAGAKPNS